MLQFSGIGTLALLALAMCWGLAVVVFRASFAGSVGRQLSLLLFVEGITLISTGYLDLFLTETARAASWYPGFFRIEEIVHTVGDCLMLALYPSFLAAALRTRVTAAFSTGRARIVMLVLAAILAVIVLWGSLKIGGTLLYISLVLLFVFALVASLDAWRSAEGVARSRAGTFAIAFGIRDICWGFVYGWATLVLWQGTYAIVDPGAPTVPFLVYALGTLTAVPIIAYGILRTQLFDIDLKIQSTIRQSTIAATFVVVFYVVTEGADRLFESEFGTWPGFVASALLILVLSPLQRLADRFSRAVMPNTTDTPEYAAYKKLQVYEAALSDALPGGISPKERALLNHLRNSLGIAAGDADALERDLSR